MFLGRVFGGAKHGLPRYAGKFIGIPDVQRPRIGSVLHIVFKACLGRRKRLHDRFESLLVGVWKIDSREMEIAQGMIDRGAMRFVFVVGQ